MIMYGKIARLFFYLMLAATIVSCGNQGDAKNDTVEDRLIRSFNNENTELRKHIAVIIEDAKAEKYQDALNKLALLSATRRLSNEQKIAVELIVRQLRYDMEEKIFSERDQQE